MCCLEDGLLPCMEYLVSLLSKCRKKQDMPFFHRIHSRICIYGLETNALSGDYLVPMLVECGNVSKAEQLFYKLLSPNEACWISLMEGYARHGQIQHSVELFNRIQVYASSATFHAALKAFTRLNFARGGQEIHIHITNKALENDLHISSSLVDMYVKCGWFTEAENVLKMLPVRNVVSWTALMVGYAEYGYVKEVLNCIEKMRLDSVSPNAFTFVCILKVCCNQRNFMDKARSIHSDIVRHGFETNPFIGSALVGTYARCALLLEGLFVFDELRVRDLVSWNSLLLLYAEHGLSDSTILCFGQMQEEGISPDGSTYVYGLKCCGNVGAIIKGRILHFAVVQGGLENDPFINSTLVDMYVRCGCLVESWNLVDDMSMHSCTALIGGYVDQGYPEEALEFYEKMEQRGMVMDSVTYACSLRACTSIKALGVGQKIHAQVLKSGLERESCVGNVLVDMYAKCGLIHEAQDVFDNLSMRNEASWSSLITGYANQNLDERVLACLEKMKSDDIVWDAVIAVCCLRACANIGVIDKGFQIHADMAQDGLDNDILVGNTLVDMYAKCGLISEARVVFDELSIRNVVSWTAIIAGYACQGKSELVFHMFEKMQEENVEPDGIALLIVLTVCRYGGHVDKGRKYFEALSNKSSPLLTIDHYNCMLDLTSSTGRFSEALEILDKMPFQPNMVTWNLMLSACRKWGNILLARNIFECALRSDVLHDATFLLMSNIFADAQMVEDVKRTELLRRNATCLEQNNFVNLFFTRDCKHIQVRDFYPKV